MKCQKAMKTLKCGILNIHHGNRVPIIFLNAILPGNDYHFGKDPKIDANRGLDMIPNLHEDTSYADDEE